MGIRTLHALQGLAAALALCAFGATSAAGAGVPVCLPDFPDLVAKEFQIPLGCDLVDCCVDCPAGPLDLHVAISGELLAGAELRLPGERDVPLDLAPGDFIYEGVIDRDQSGPAPLAGIRLRVDEKQLERASPEAVASLEVALKAGTTIVSLQAWSWKLAGCEEFEPCDRIKLLDNTDGDRSVTLLDGRRGSECVDDEIGRAKAERVVGNMLPSTSDCESEVAVFSSENAMSIQENVSVWTDACGDVLPVDLEPTLSADTTFVLAVPEWLAKLEWGHTAEWVAKLDLTYANSIYDDNKTGISFGMDKVELDFFDRLELVFLLPGALLEALVVGGLDFNAVACAIPSQFEDKGFYIPGRLNVYYVGLPFAGMTCMDERSIMFIGLWKKPATLAHEFGHSLSLLGDGGHTNELEEDFESKNVMWSGGSEIRHHLSLGQAFRQNLEHISTLNTNAVRTDVERACPMIGEPSGCPPLAHDWARP
jgi:hypothetical protein